MYDFDFGLHRKQLLENKNLVPTHCQPKTTVDVWPWAGDGDNSAKKVWGMGWGWGRKWWGYGGDGTRGDERG